MEPSELQSKRRYIGLLAILFLIVSGGVWWFDPERQAVYGAMLRVGTMLGAFWLAIPVMVRHPKILKRLPWYLLGGIVLFAAFARYLWMMIPLLILLGILSMFAGKRPHNRQ